MPKFHPTLTEFYCIISVSSFNSVLEKKKKAGNLENKTHAEVLLHHLLTWGTSLTPSYLVI